MWARSGVIQAIQAKVTTMEVAREKINFRKRHGDGLEEDCLMGIIRNVCYTAGL